MKKSNLKTGAVITALSVFLAGCGGGGSGGGAGGFNLPSLNTDTQTQQVATATGNAVDIGGTTGKIVQTTGNATAITVGVVGGDYTGGNLELNLHTAQTGQPFVVGRNDNTYIGEYANSASVSGVSYTNKVVVHRGTGSNDNNFVVADLYYSNDATNSRFAVGGFWFVVNFPGAGGVATPNLTTSHFTGLNIADMGAFVESTPFTNYAAGNTVNSNSSSVVYDGDFVGYFAPDNNDTVVVDTNDAYGFAGDVSFTADFSNDTLTGSFSNIVDGGSGENVGVRFDLTSTNWNTANRAFVGRNAITCTGTDATVSNCSVNGGSSFNGIFGGGGTPGAEPNYFGGIFGLDGLLINYADSTRNSGDVIGIFDSEKQ